MRRALRTFLLLAALAPLRAAASVEVPVAVMPFKNLNADPALDWLKAGMAETMVSDLKKGAGLAVVERSQLDHALAELALRGSAGTDEATAAQVGKLTGAKTVVLGSFQSAGSQVRIAARFVTVETGVVQDAVKVTGPLDEIFRLQDDVVAKLSGVPAPGTAAPQARKPRKAGPQVVKAYRLYAMSLSTGSDAEKVGYLRDALKEDAEFTYAADDLAALQSRMKDYDDAAERARSAHEAKERSALRFEGDTPEQRTQHAYQLLASEMSTLRYRQLLSDAGAVYAMDLGPSSGGAVDAHTFAAYALFFAHQMLKQRDLALQVGEQFLKNFPSSPYYGSVEMQMNQIIREKHEMDAGVAGSNEELAKLDAEKAEVLAHPPRAGVNDLRLHSLDYQRCMVLYRYRQYERAVAQCLAYEDTNRGLPEDKDVNFVALSMYHRALSLAELGRFGEAREVIRALTERDAPFAEKMSIATVSNSWPKE